MARVSEQISKANASNQGKTDANLANDSLHLGGIPAEEYATKKYVQDYHDQKETNLKDYIDKQDAEMLRQAKEYTNSQIRNQDFSDFAKQSDIKALDDKLTKKIDDGLKEQKEYTDGKCQQIVDDANENFSQIENAIGSLNKKTDDLFISVSNGKSKVAGAITDKGVPTSANDTFNTMANNIRQIKTDGGGSDPNYVNTSDATAIASDVLLGKTAYVKGEKLFGTLIAKPEEGYPTYGTDTSDATAVASDIAYGKTAYARGQKITGNMSLGVEEIYGTVDNEPYIVSYPNMATGNPPDGKEKIKNGSRYNLTFSRNGNYCVSNVIGETTGTKYIESFEIQDDGLVYQASSGQSGIAIKKYRYTYQELGIVDAKGQEGNITGFAFSPAGFAGKADRCILAVVYEGKNAEDKSENYLRLLTYHLSDNGAIGKAFDTERLIIDVTVSNIWGSKVTFANNDIKKLYLADIKLSGRNRYLYTTVCEIRSKSTEESIGYDVSTYKTEYNKALQENYIANIECTGNDSSLILNLSGMNNIPSNTLICKIDEYKTGNMKSLGSNDYFAGQTVIAGVNYISSVKKVLEDNKIMEFNLYSITEENGETLITKVKTLKLKKPENESSYDFIKSGVFTNEGKELIFIYGSYDASNGHIDYAKILIYKFDNIMSIADNTEVNVSQEEFIELDIEAKEISTLTNTDNTRIYIGRTISGTGSYNDRIHVKQLTIALDKENIIGIKYKNQYFVRAKEHTYTAGGGDVRKGKTFIGWMGYPETGTGEF